MMMRLYCHHPYKPIQTPIISPSLSPSNLSLSPRRLSCSLLHPTTPLHLRSSTFLCSMNTSDVKGYEALQSSSTKGKRKRNMTSQLEIEKPEERIKQEKQVNGIFWIILLNIGVFVADHFYQVRAMQSLYFYHNRPAWFQYVTSIFCHANWAHLSSNLYFLYIFGKLVEEEEGSFGLWLSYILTGAGANIVSWLLLPRNTVSVRASGAVYGLFAISVLVKMSWDWRKILEVLILGQFVIGRVTEAAQASTAMLGFMRGSPALEGVDHIAHLSGALIGVLLIWLINLFSSLPDAEDLSNKQNKNE